MALHSLRVGLDRLFSIVYGPVEGFGDRARREVKTLVVEVFTEPPENRVLAGSTLLFLLKKRYRF